MRRLHGLALLLAFTVGCAPRPDGDAARASASDVATSPAPVAAAADMCAEHGVLEAVCTRCQPNLIPIFKGKGDWCAEHEFPESFCPACHPERGGRPAVDVAVEEAPAQGTLIRFDTPEIARQVGIETVAAAEVADTSGVTATATVVVDAAHYAVVNARMSGIVRAIRADVGSRVRAGAPLATIESAEVGEARSRLKAAQARLQVAESNHRREQELHARGIVALQAVELAAQEMHTARADVEAAESALRMMGAEAGVAGTCVLTAPIAGVVTRRAATVGTLVDPEETLFEIVDTSSLWADIDVAEADAPRVRPGQAVVLHVEGLPGAGYPGRIESVAPVVDSRTRTVRARARLGAHDGALRANSYARATILTGAAGTTVAVPRAAIQEARGVSLAFVRLAEDLYETRRVRLAPGTGEQAMVASGLEPGERVATVGSFLLKTETMKEGIGAGCCEVEPPAREGK
jgi:cobalt-zinc-cadmium efflux system membrane fusion protein